MKRALKVISKVGVFTMVLFSFQHTLGDNVPSAILFVIGWLCAFYYFLFEEV